MALLDAAAGAFCCHANGPIAQVSAVSLTLCVLLWARPDTEEGLIAYEDRVLGIAAEHGGRVLQRARGSGIDGQPLEVQLLDFPSASASMHS